MRLAWSELAKAELRQLRRHSVERWGRDVAVRYLEDVRDVARRVADEPRRARQLRGAFRIVRVRSHYLIVYVDEASDRVTVARVLHTAMNLDRHLQDLPT